MAQWTKAFVSKLNGLSPVPRVHVVEVEKEICAHTHAPTRTHMCTHTSVTDNERKNSISWLEVLTGNRAPA